MHVVPPWICLISLGESVILLFLASWYKLFILTFCRLWFYEDFTTTSLQSLDDMILIIEAKVNRLLLLNTPWWQNNKVSTATMTCFPLQCRSSYQDEDDKKSHGRSKHFNFSESLQLDRKNLNSRCVAMCHFQCCHTQILYCSPKRPQISLSRQMNEW